MQIESITVELPRTDKISTEYIEKELIKRNINPLRWAIVFVNDKIYEVSIANLKRQEGKL